MLPVRVREATGLRFRPAPIPLRGTAMPGIVLFFALVVLLVAIGFFVPVVWFIAAGLLVLAVAYAIFATRRATD